MMNNLLKITTLWLYLALVACASLARQAPPLGASMAEVATAWGRPSASYRDGADTLLEYATGPMGQSTYMARMGADGRMRSFEQVLDSAHFARIQVGKFDQADVLRTIGRPAEQSRVFLGDYEVWSYRYKENGVWNSMMHVHFDRHGVVRMLMNGPDPMYDEERHFFW